MKKRATTKTPDTRTLSEKRRDAALKGAERRRMISVGLKHSSVPCLKTTRTLIGDIANERRITLTDAVALCVEAYHELHAKSRT